ncbi:MAG: alpha/beta hydrolase [Bacteroidota bacterium]
MKPLFKLLDTVAPGFAAKEVYKVMSNPRKRRLKDFEEEVLDRAKQERIPFGKFEIQTYAWGNPENKSVFLIHGWEGQAGNFGALVDILLEKGYYVQAFDGPSHGKSTIGKTNMFEFVDLVELLLRKYQPETVVSHSFGSVTSVIALGRNPQIKVKKWLLVTTPHNFRNRIKQVSEFLGLTDRTVSKVIDQLESNTQMKVDEMNMAYYGPQVSHIEEITIVHSQSDKVIPIESAHFTHEHMPQSTLYELDGMGHYAILWSKELKDIVISCL